MTIHRDLTNIIFYIQTFLQNYIQTYKKYYTSWVFKRKFLKIKESLKTRNFEKECF